MLPDQPPAQPPERFGPTCSRVAGHGLRFAHRNLWRLLGLAGKLALLLYFLFGALVLGLRYGVLPNIDHYKPRVEQLASAALGQPVRIGSIGASWSGLTPRLALADVQIQDHAGRVALRLPRVDAALSWWSVVAGTVRLDALEIDRPDLDIVREADGRLFVGGILIDTRKSGDASSAEWVLAQHRIVIHEGRVRWRDARRNAPPLLLEHVNFGLENAWQRHAFALSAQPPAALAAPLDLRGIFHHPRFTLRSADVSQWWGTLYADVRSPDLAAWHAYVDAPLKLDTGRGAVRAWLFFDREKVIDFTADLHLDGVAVQLAPALPTLQLVRVDGRLGVQEGASSTQAQVVPTAQVGTVTRFGASGHTITLTDFSMLTNDGLRLPTTTLSEKFTPAQAGRPEQFMLTARLLDLRTLASLGEHLPLPPAQRRMLQDFAPQGLLQDFSASWQGTYPAIASYALKGRFSNLSLQAQPAHPGRARTATAAAQAAVPAIPGFDNLTGSVDANDRGGAFTLAAQGLKLHAPGYFADPVLRFDQFDMRASWAFKPGDQLLLEIASLQFVREGLHGSLSGRHLMPLGEHPDRPLGSIDINGKFSGLEIARIDQYLPLATPPNLRAWLDGALLGGTLQNATLRLKGDLTGFPFHPAAGSTVPPAGDFNVSGQIVNGRLDVAPGHLAKDGKASLWPLIDNLQGSIMFDRGRMEIDARSALIHKVAVDHVKAVIPDLLVADRQLAVTGTASGALQELVGFVNDSPVGDWIGRFTDDTRASGNAVLSLKLDLPLARLAESAVQGSLQFGANDVVLQPAMPVLAQTAGKLDFNQKGVTLNAIRAGFLGGPVLISGGTQRDGSIVIKADGSLSAEGLRRTFAAPALKGLTERVSGASKYATTISVRKKHLEILVESTLQGMALDLPPPLRKPAAEVLPLKFEIAGVPGEEAAGSRDEIRLSLGTAFSARYLRQKGTERNADWRVVRGGIGVNVPAPQPDSGLTANVSLRTLNIDAWRALANSVTGERGKSGAASADPSASGLGQYVTPDVLAARATELIVAGKKLDNVVVGVSHQKGLWQANIDAVQASGYVSWNEPQSGTGLGRVTARLSSLIIPKTAESDVSDILEGKNTTTQIPALDIVTENFELFGKKLGKLELEASNVRNGAALEWRINKLLLANPDAELKATGIWSRADAGRSATSLNYRLEIANAGKLLERFGYANVLKGGKGMMAGDISWQGLPFSLDVPSLGGQMAIDVAAGQFLKVDPGAAKLLGVLSLQSLPRRLTLDFRDVFSQGFAFDGIAGTVGIAQGVARTDNLKMRSVSATVLVDGSADIAHESQNLHVAVIPEINVGTASVVYALAVNPVIGLGTFLAQLFLREPLMRAFTFEYLITGPWKLPEVVKVERNKDKVPQAALTPGTAG